MLDFCLPEWRKQIKRTYRNHKKKLKLPKWMRSVFSLEKREKIEA